MSDRAFPFILNQVRVLAEENKYEARRSEEMLSEWKDLSLISTGLEMRLNRLESKIKPKWADGCKEVRRLLQDLLRIKRLIGFLWGEATTKRIFRRIYA